MFEHAHGVNVRVSMETTLFCQRITDWKAVGARFIDA